MAGQFSGLRERVLTKGAFFTEAHLWPLELDLNPEGWLSNFDSAEEECALHLLDGFMYFSNWLTEQLFRAAFAKLRDRICRDVSLTVVDEHWRNFQNDLIVTHVTGDAPSDTDSGFIFSRMSRQVLGIETDSIITHEEAIAALLARPQARILFVDDFVGSGDQFLTTWNRLYDVPSQPVKVSYASVLRSSTNRAFYCPVICGSLGRRILREQCPEVVLSPAHFLDERYSVFSDNSIVLPPHLRQTGPEFIREASDRAQITRNWRGYQGQGLLVAFEHCVPDATIPLIYHESQTPYWQPLVRRK
jgi:hypothetical protein